MTDCVKKKSTNAMKSALHEVCTVVLNELWHVRACVMTVTFELAIDGFGDKRLGGVNVQ
jgi:hypothetical protein